MTSTGPETGDRQPRQLQAIDATMEFAKHQITFAAILVGLSITLNKDLIPKDAWWSLTFLRGSWIIQVFSIISGFVTLGAIVHHLGSSESLDSYTWRIRFPLFLQFSLLMLGICLLIGAVWPHMGGAIPDLLPGTVLVSRI